MPTSAPSPFRYPLYTFPIVRFPSSYLAFLDDLSFSQPAFCFPIKFASADRAAVSSRTAEGVSEAGVRFRSCRPALFCSYSSLTRRQNAARSAAALVQPIGPQHPLAPHSRSCTFHLCLAASRSSPPDSGGQVEAIGPPSSSGSVDGRCSCCSRSRVSPLPHPTTRRPLA